MITKELTVKSGPFLRDYDVVEPKQKESARNHIPRSPIALIILLFDHLIKVDPR
jgi:hypothetical protein